MLSHSRLDISGDATPMSIYHVNQIQNRLQTTFEGLIDLSDYEKKAEAERADCFLSRALAAYALSLEATIANDIAASCVTDGFDDNGIDAVYLRKTDKESTLFLIQSKWSKDGNSSPDLDGVGKFIRGIENLLEQKFDKFNEKLNKKRTEILAALLDPSCKVIAILVHSSSQKLGTHPQKEIDEFCANVNDTTEFLEFVTLDQSSLFKSLALGGTATKINLNVGITEWGKKDEPHFAVYGMVDAKQVADWWNEYQSRLFEKNLRGILGETSVNKEIKDTLEKTPENFWYFNNGITIVADAIKRGPLNATNRAYSIFQCEGISIVNGAQTVTTIGRFFQKATTEPIGAMIPLRIISVEGTEDLDAEITKANNTQNRIEGRDFAAVDQEQQRIRLELSILQIDYQLIRNEGFAPGPKAFDVEEAISALACAKGDPDLAIIVKREIGKFWENTRKPPYTDVIRKNVHGQYVLNVVLTQRKIDDILRGLSMPATLSRGASILIWGNKLISSIVFLKVGQKILSESSDALTQFINTKAFNNLVREVGTILVSEVEEKYTGYVANTFKNTTKSKEIYALVSEQVADLK